MVDTLYTIGYSGFVIESFIAEIKKHGVSSIIDVRSNPYSRRYSDYNKEILQSTLNKNGIYYRNYAKEFGAQQTNKAFYSDKGYLDFEKFSKSESFIQGVAKLEGGMEQDYTFGLMCAEKTLLTVIGQS